MNQFTMYECEKCGYTSKYAKEVEECEAGHVGLTLEEYKHYQELKKNAERCGRTTSVCKNEHTDAAFDKAIKDLIAFEKEHNLSNGV